MSARHPALIEQSAAVGEIRKMDRHGALYRRPNNGRAAQTPAGSCRLTERLTEESRIKGRFIHFHLVPVKLSSA